MKQSNQKSSFFSYFCLHTVSSFLILGLFWLGNSGLYTPLLLVFGLLSVIFVVWLSHRMNIIDAESQPFHLVLRGLPAYYVWLLKKIVQANISVVSCIWRGNQSISPCLAHVPNDLHSEVGQVIFANSITLTPGTVAIDLGEEGIFVHALTSEGRDELLEGEMGRRVARLER